MAKHRRRHTIGTRHDFQEPAAPVEEDAAALAAPVEKVHVPAPARRRHRQRRMPRIDFSALGDLLFAARWLLVAVLAIAALASGWWFFLRPRTITVCVFSDATFRQHHSDWLMLVHTRFEGANRIFEPTGVHWKVLTPDASDPTGVVSGLDARRMALAANTDLRADVLVIVSGVPEGKSTGATMPFSHTAIVVDFPDKSEEQNTAILAHELAHLFGESHYPEGSGTIMQEFPRSSNFSPRTAKLIRELRNYDFAAGYEALEGAWEQKAVAAITQAQTGIFPLAAANAQQIVSVALLLGERRAAAIRHAREAVAAAPDSTDMQVFLAYALTRNSQDDAAITELRGAALRDPHKGVVHQNLGMLLSKQGNLQEALKEFRTQVEIDPGNAEAHAALAGAELTLGDVEAAAKEFRRAIELSPEMAVAHAGLANVHYLRRDYAAAWDEVKKSRMAGFEPPQEFISNLTAKRPE